MVLWSHRSSSERQQLKFLDRVHVGCREKLNQRRRITGATYKQRMIYMDVGAPKSPSKIAFRIKYLNEAHGKRLRNLNPLAQSYEASGWKYLCLDERQRVRRPSVRNRNPRHWRRYNDDRPPSAAKYSLNARKRTIATTNRSNGFVRVLWRHAQTWP